MYTFKISDNATLTVSQNDIIEPLDADSNLPITLYGKNFREYGQQFQNNLYYLLENFCGPSAPQHPVIGMLWYDNKNDMLKIYTGKDKPNGPWMQVAYEDMPTTTTTTTTEAPTTTTTSQDVTSTTTQNTTTTTTEVTEIPGNPAPTSNGIDLVFVVDYTGSMSDVITSIKNNITDIADIVSTKSNANYRLGLVLFDEFKYPLVSNKMDFSYPQYINNADYIGLPSQQKFSNNNTTIGAQQVVFAMEVMSDNNINSFKTQLNKINQPKKSTTPFDAFCLGSGNTVNGPGVPEPGDLALDKVYNNIAGTFRNNVAKIVVFVTDAVAGGTDDTNAAADIATVGALAQQYHDKNIRLLLLTTDSSATTPPQYNPISSTDQSYVTMANTTGGSVSTPITDASLIIDAIRNIP